MISLQNISKTFQTPAGSFAALKNINLDINQGEFVGLIGKSGSGKSTLLNMIGGIDRPTTGKVSIANTEIQNLREHKLALWRGRTVGFVFQFFQLLPTLTVVENIMLPMDFSGTVPVRERRTRALSLLALVDVENQADKMPVTLSGGEQQRVAIARALANEPAVVLADEPTGNLDSVTAHSVLNLFRTMATAGTTVVIATHEPEIAGIIDRTVEISDGTLIN